MTQSAKTDILASEWKKIESPNKEIREVKEVEERVSIKKEIEVRKSQLPTEFDKTVTLRAKDVALKTLQIGRASCRERVYALV